MIRSQTESHCRVAVVRVTTAVNSSAANTSSTGNHFSQPVQTVDFLWGKSNKGSSTYDVNNILAILDPSSPTPSVSNRHHRATPAPPSDRV